jgi:hypothetical protein
MHRDFEDDLEKLKGFPPDKVCPRRFCFNFLEAGSSWAPGLHKSVDEALTKLQPVPEDQCGCFFGVCTRLDPVNGDADCYEPCEPALRQAGLPDDFFVAKRSSN